MSITEKIHKNGDFSHLVKRHPCFNAEAHVKHGRIHLPVSPACNILCRFCRREFNTTDVRPGVSHGILSPADAVATVTRALELCPSITVVGIAGPGESLATPHALETLRLVHASYPELIGCLSTNGLRLTENVEELVKVGVRTITVTVNAVDAQLLPLINGGIILDGKRQDGAEAAEILITAQLAGIDRAAEQGLVVKVNSVLIPGVNDEHIPVIARTVAAHGATIYNIIPLIPQHEMAHITAPDCQLLNKVRGAAEEYLPVFRHCRHCRADACGIPGQEDLADKLYEHRVETFSHG
ncbi:MAG: radical SAM protein [bacterium]